MYMKLSKFVKEEGKKGNPDPIHHTELYNINE
jgi:hypothetical protein